MLMEMLIAIAIFTSQLENSREATDAANIRSGCAVVSAKVLTDGGTVGVSADSIELQQRQDGWRQDIRRWTLRVVRHRSSQLRAAVVRE